MSTPDLPTPHRLKMKALTQNQRLPDADKERVQEALRKYQDWIEELESIPRGRQDTISKLVESTNRYKRFIELDLIFDSPETFLYRQKGQLKLDNTILEEFLPQLIYRSLDGIDVSYQLGPRKIFAGISFLSSAGAPGIGGNPNLRTKDQDFILGKKLFDSSKYH